MNHQPAGNLAIQNVLRMLVNLFKPNAVNNAGVYALGDSYWIGICFDEEKGSRKRSREQS